MSERRSPEEIARVINGAGSVMTAQERRFEVAIVAAIRALRLQRVAALEAQAACLRVCIQDLCGCHSDDIDECCQCIGEDACPCHAALSGAAGRELLEAARERLRRGHDGACDCVRSERGCECGHDRLCAALGEGER